jgi:hypothetical protein
MTPSSSAWRTLALTGVAVFVVSLDGTVLFVAFPAIRAPSQGTHGSSCAGIRSFRWRPRRLLSGASSLQLQVLDFQKENEYGEVSLVDLGWRWKSPSKPRDR